MNAIRKCLKLHELNAQLVAFLAELKSGRINPAGAEQEAPF